MKRTRIRRPRVRSERLGLEALSPDPRDPDIVRAKARARTARSKLDQTEARPDCEVSLWLMRPGSARGWFSFLEVPRWHEARLWAADEMTVDGQGRAYIGLFGLAGGGLARVDLDGSARVVANGMLLPNGQALSADGRTLIVAESAGQRLSAFTVGASGSLTDRRVWASLGEPATATTLPEVIAQVSVWPDGIALDGAGAVWMANPSGREVLRVVEGGEITDWALNW